MNTTEFLHLTAAPMGNSQNRIATAIPVSLPLHLDFLFLLILRPPPTAPGSHRQGDLHQSQFLLCISSQSSPCPCSWGSIDSLSIPFVILREGSRGTACGYKVSSSVQQCPRPSHSLITHVTDSPRATSSPAGSIHGDALHRCTIFYLLYHIFTLPFLCLGTQILTIVL